MVAGARKLEEVPTGQLPEACVEDSAEQHADRAPLMDVLRVPAPKQRSVVVLRHGEPSFSVKKALVRCWSTVHPVVMLVMPRPVIMALPSRVG
ncbi:hypothetical protein GCM10020295_34830 [Streptomyces cinereospinus]